MCLWWEHLCYRSIIVVFSVFLHQFKYKNSSQAYSQLIFKFIANIHHGHASEKFSSFLDESALMLYTLISFIVCYGRCGVLISCEMFSLPFIVMLEYFPCIFDIPFHILYLLTHAYLHIHIKYIRWYTGNTPFEFETFYLSIFSVVVVIFIFVLNSILFDARFCGNDHLFWSVK